MSELWSTLSDVLRAGVGRIAPVFAPKAAVEPFRRHQRQDYLQTNLRWNRVQHFTATTLGITTRNTNGS